MRHCVSMETQNISELWFSTPPCNALHVGCDCPALGEDSRCLRMHISLYISARGPRGSLIFWICSIFFDNLLQTIFLNSWEISNACTTYRSGIWGQPLNPSRNPRGQVASITDGAGGRSKRSLFCIRPAFQNIRGFVFGWDHNGSHKHHRHHRP
jgi:hypothetical protein